MCERSMWAVALLWMCGYTGGAGAVSSNVRTAQIAANLTEPGLNAHVNMSYYFGIYGKGSLAHPVTGHLIHVTSQGGINDGCSDYNHDLPDHDWVALVERGTCYFHDKILTATKRYNASAVIIYDNQVAKNFIVMQSTVKDEVYIYVMQRFGRRLALLLDSGFDIYVTITPIDVHSSSDAPPFSPVYFQLLPLLLLAFLWTVVNAS